MKKAFMNDLAKYNVEIYTLKHATPYALGLENFVPRICLSMLTCALEGAPEAPAIFSKAAKELFAREKKILADISKV